MSEHKETSEFTRIDGYEPAGEEVPGVGPVIACSCKDNEVTAVRNNGHENIVYIYSNGKGKWVKK